MKFVFVAVIIGLALVSMAQAQGAGYEKTLYVLSIGVNQVKGVQHLEYAEKDANDFVEVVEKRKGKSSYSEIHSIKLLNSNATTTNIKAILQTMAGKSDFCKNNTERCTIQDEITKLTNQILTNRNSNRLRPEDGLLIFFSGHGYRECKEKDKDSKCLNENFGNKLHLIVSDTKVKEIEKDGKTEFEFKDSWSDEDFEENLAEIQAGRMAIILDSCFSGASEATSDDWRLGPLNSSGFSQLIYEKGIFILASSQKNQTSRERKTVGRGIFTNALIESLPEKESINLDDWFKKSNDKLFGIEKDSKLEPKDQICKKGVPTNENRPLNPAENIRTGEMKNPVGIIAEIREYPELNKLYEPYRNSSNDEKVNLARFFTDNFFSYSDKNINLCQAKWTDEAFEKQFSELKKCESVFCLNRIILQELLKGENNLSGQDKEGRITSLDLLQEPKFLFYKREQIDPTAWNF
jgi:uncharacterized caspase-like protein